MQTTYPVLVIPERSAISRTDGERLDGPDDLGAVVEDDPDGAEVVVSDPATAADARAWFDRPKPERQSKPKPAWSKTPPRRGQFGETFRSAVRG